MTAAAIRRLGDEALAREPSLGTLLGRLADAVDDGRATEAEGYIGAIDARGLAELLAGAHSRFWAVLEVLRNVLVFAPIAVTWFGLSLAAGAYADMLAARPELVSQPFLLLWEQGFGGRLLFNFGTLALIDASLIGILILLSFTLHLRRSPGARRRRHRAAVSDAPAPAIQWRLPQPRRMAVGRHPPRPLRDLPRRESGRLCGRDAEPGHRSQAARVPRRGERRGPSLDRCLGGRNGTGARRIRCRGARRAGAPG